MRRYSATFLTLPVALLLAAFIGAQNLPEGFNAFREITDSGMKSRTALTTLLAASLLGPLAACTGYFFLQNREGLTAGMRRHWLPPFGAVIGFAVGILGKMLIG